MIYTKFEDIKNKYDVLYIDPPWSYNNKHTGGSLSSGASSKYYTMDLNDIMMLPIESISKDNCILFLWSTVPLLQEALALLNIWKFKYKTKLTWNKKGKLGMGFWFRVCTEDLLIGIKGDVKPFGYQKSNMIDIKPGKHSEKPNIFREIIEEITPNMNRIELFARKEYLGWDCFGNEIETNNLKGIINDI